MSEVDELLTRQSGVVSRTQLADAGVPRRTRDTMLRRRQLVPVLPGVYVNHTDDRPGSSGSSPPSSMRDVLRSTSTLRSIIQPAAG